MESIAYVAYHKDEKIAKKSSSGGAFSAISDVWLSHYSNAVVYGCVLNEKLTATHVRATDATTRDKMKGSKYVASYMGGILEEVEKDIRQKKYVMFTGTPCQIAGLYMFLKLKNVDYEEFLITIEVICHGVASELFFKDYIENLEKKYKSKAISCNFRAKSKPEKKQDMEVIFENGKKYNASSTRFDWFYSIYLKNLILRPSCYKCKYACETRNADISLADLWGVKDGDIRAKSLVLVNTVHGKILFEQCDKQLDITTIEMENVHQPHMHAPCKKTEEYEMFWSIYKEKGYLTVQKIFGYNSVKGKLISYGADIANRLNVINILKKLKK